MLSSHAAEIMFAQKHGLEFKAFEYAQDRAVSVQYAEDHEIYCFDDGSQVRCYINEDHEITFVEC